MAMLHQTLLFIVPRTSLPAIVIEKRRILSSYLKVLRGSPAIAPILCCRKSITKEEASKILGCKVG